MFISHRGNDNHNYRENSDRAILCSLDKSYIDGVEFDIRLTLDNQIILSHNALIDLESDGSGFIHNMTLDELLSYNFKEDKITVLDNLLFKIKTNKILLLEIKEEGNRIIEWIDALNYIFKKYQYLNIYICSFNYELLCELKSAFKNILCGIIVGHVMNKKKDISSFDFVMYHYNSFKYVHKKTMVWTINSKEKYKMFKNKTDYIITDKAYELL